MERTTLPRSWFSRSNWFVRSTREMGEQGKSRSSRLQWKHHPGMAEGRLFLSLPPNHGTNPWKSQYFGMPASLPGVGNVPGEGCSVGHIPWCCSTQPCCSQGFLCGRRGREQGAGCGNGVEQHNPGHTGSFLNAFIDCSVHVRM